MITWDIEILSPHCCNAHIWSVDELQFGSVQLMSLSRSNLGSNYNNVTSQTQVIPFGINGQWEFSRGCWLRITLVCPLCIVTLTMGHWGPGLWQCNFAEIMIGFRVSKYGNLWDQKYSLKYHSNFKFLGFHWSENLDAGIYPGLALWDPP